MKQIILGMALFAGSFALANGSVKTNDSKLLIPETTCSCELDGLGTCYITIYHSNGSTTTYTYYNVTQAWCEWKAKSFSLGLD